MTLLAGQEEELAKEELEEEEEVRVLPSPNVAVRLLTATVAKLSCQLPIAAPMTLLAGQEEEEEEEEEALRML
jgi:hypothetical protein